MIAQKYIDRFWSNVDKSGEHWLWTAGRFSDGYGQFHVVREEGKRYGIRAHRFAWELNHGPIPPGVQVLHRCDIPLCVRDEDLWLGSVADNMRDKMEKGRHAHGDTHGWRLHPDRVLVGEAHYAARLTADDVRAILKHVTEGVSQVELAKRFRVRTTTINAIVCGRNWRSITLLPNRR